MLGKAREQRTCVLQSAEHSAVQCKLVLGRGPARLLHAKTLPVEPTLDGTVWKLTTHHGDNNNGESMTAGGASTLGPTPTEVVLPRSIVDLVKKRWPLIWDKCPSINIAFVPSESNTVARGVLAQKLIQKALNE